MKKRVALVVAVVGLALSAYRFQNQKVCDGFLPENDMKIPVGDVNAAGIGEDVFNSVLDRAEKVYGPIIASKGGRLVVKRLWSNATVNASANQSMGTWYINMYGGLARHAAITEGGFALVACHEIGHHIGGFPKMSWATNEGGADYFATLKCLRLLYPNVEPPAVDPVAGAACDAQYSDETGRKSCKIGAMGGDSVAALFHAMRPGSPRPAFNTPDASVVDRTNNAHPAAQCRLDTYFQGALCTKPVSEELSNTGAAAGSCTTGAGYKVGVRSLCWYKPAEPEAVPAALSVARMPNTRAVQKSLDALREAMTGRGL